MPDLYLTRGLPGTGKTTLAKRWVQESPASCLRVNRDDLRMMLFGEKVNLTYTQENTITHMQQAMVHKALVNGFDVIVDDMHLRPKYIREWYEVAKKAEVGTVRLVEFPTSLEQVKEANRTRPQQDSVPDTVLDTMYSRYTRKGKLLPVESYEDFLLSKVETPRDWKPLDPYDPNNLDLDPVILVDIDGTLALNTSGRGWYDWDRVGEDTPNIPVVELVRILEAQGIPTIYLSGRDEVCREITLKWLRRHRLNPDTLIMRAEGDNRKDDIVKYELIDEHVRDKYNVMFVLDDRPSVCRMHRAIGLTTLQVGDPHVEF